MARFHTNSHCNFSTLTSLPFPRMGLWWPLLLLLLGFILPARIGVAAQSGEGYCTNSTSKTVSYTTTLAYSEAVKTSKGCGLFGWSRCTTYREMYRTRQIIRYRIAYRRENICCEGWMGETKDPRLVCIKIPDPTTAAPVNVSDIDIPTAELPVNYSGSIVTSLHTAVTIATIDDTTDPGTLPGGPVSDAGPGGFFTGEKGKWKLIGLVLIVVVMILVVIVLTAIFVCYRKRRKRESKLANLTPELELLNRSVPSNNGRVGESPYAEIPDGQTEESQLMTNSTRDLNEASTNGPAGTRGANQYHEIADVLQAESTDLPPVPSTEAHLPVESRGGYAYAYIDSKSLSRRGDGETGDENAGNVELKADGPTAEYAEVHKNKPRHPKSSESSNNGDEEVNVTSENEDIPTNIQAYVTHIPINQGEIENQQNYISEADQEKGIAIHDNPEPYGEVEFGKGLPQNNEYDNFQRAGSKTGYTDSGDVPKPYGELGPTSSPNPEITGYDKIKRSNSRQDSMDACEEPLTSGYGVVLNEASSEKPPASHTYDTVGNQNPGNVKSDQNHRDMYDRLDRQISTTSMQNGSPTMKHPEKLQKNSRTYSKLNRSTSRQDPSITPSLQGYGVLGDERHDNIPPQVYDKLDSGNQLSAKVPVQDFNDYGHMGAGNHGEVPSNTYNSLKNCNPPANPPEGAYATIPNDMSSSLPSETYDKLQRGGNDTVGASHADDGNRIKYDTIGPRNGTSSVYNTPGSSRPAPGIRPPLSRHDTLYENTPKGNQESSDNNDPHTVGRGHGNPVMQSSGTYNTPSHNSVTRKDSSRSDTSSIYDLPPSRNSVTRQDSLGKALPANVAYDTPLSRNSVTRQDTIYENTARPKSDAQGPEQYEKMAKGARISNVSAGSYYEDMKGNRSSRGSQGSRASLDSSVPSPFSAGSLTKQDSLYENTPREYNM